MDALENLRVSDELSEFSSKHMNNKGFFCSAAVLGYHGRQESYHNAVATQFPNLLVIWQSHG